MRPSRVLYHYTSGVGLMGILNSHTVWASNIHQLNDASEFSHAIDMARNEIARVAALHSHSNAGKLGLALCEILERCRQISVYVTCFSEVPDSLSQWRGYCPDGFGYNIGFDEQALRAATSAQGFVLSQCLYDQSKQRTLLNAWAQSCVEELLPIYDPAAEIHKLEQDSGGMLQSLFTLAPFFKHPSFADEREWRIAKTVRSDAQELQLRAGKSMLIQYLPVKVDLSVSGQMIWDICVGPTPLPDLAMDALTHYFSKINIPNGIRRSESPYRSW